ncbi:UDP-glycosyltransferase 74G1 [Camellia lanceoleosa]|uniref:UDP-glycosyltransferase 74G1 n=1 Tax=Camellia lanceoleosa TaxID=1840588 RepID=A0ACC0F5P7_9ERIC|nr:UDP-glycosyltransferase 74G1 [Camellia lanceoleosa]
MEKPNKAYKAHVLVLPYPAQGHINPMLQFSKRLVTRGVKATLANTVCISKSMIVDLSSSTIDIDTISDGYDEGGYNQAESPEAYLARLHDVGSRTLADLIKKLDCLGRPVDAIVYDGFLPWALDVAKEFGILGVVFFTQTCAVNSIYYHVHKGLLPLPLSPGSTVLLPGLLPLEPWETPSFVCIYGSFPAFYDLVVNQFSNIDQTDWVLFNTFYKLEEEVVDWMAKLWRVRTIGPTVPSMYLDELLKDDTDYGINLFKPKSSVCMNWLSDKQIGSVVYVSFGSRAKLESEQMEEIAWGLKQSNYNLWVVRETEETKLQRTSWSRQSRRAWW